MTGLVFEKLRAAGHAKVALGIRNRTEKRLASIKALGTIRHERAISALEHILFKREQPFARAAITALANHVVLKKPIAGVSVQTPLIKAMESHSDAETRVAAATVLAEKFPSFAVESARGILSLKPNEDKEVLQRALEILGTTFGLKTLKLDNIDKQSRWTHFDEHLSLIRGLAAKARKGSNLARALDAHFEHISSAIAPGPRTPVLPKQPTHSQLPTWEAPSAARDLLKNPGKSLREIVAELKQMKDF